MTEFYPHAPVAEAVIELRTAPISFDRVRDAADRIFRHYAKREDLFDFELQATIGPNAKAGIKQNPVGFRLISEDGADLAQVRVPGLSVSRMAPYPGWEHLISGAQRDWSLFRKRARPARLERLGVRSINRIDVPVEGGDRPFEPSRYVMIEPRFELPLKVQHQAAQIISVMRIPTEGLGVRLTSGEVPAPVINHRSVALDVDIYCDVDVPQVDEEICLGKCWANQAGMYFPWK